MADEQLKIAVDVNIKAALAALSDLQDELEDLADKIDRVSADANVFVTTDVGGIDRELTVLSSKIESWEAANGIDIDTNVDSSTLEALLRSRGIGGGGGGGGGGRNIDFADLTPAVRGLDPGERVRGTRGGFADARRVDPMRDTFNSLRRAVGKLTDSSQTFDLRMSDMHNMLARLMPLLAVFIGAIPAAVTAIATLAAAALSAAAALAVIAGLGALGFALEDGEVNMQNLTDAFQQIQDGFIDAFAPLANELEPLFEDALSGLERFFDAVAAEGDALLALTDEARAFGAFIIEFVPDALRVLSGLIQAFSADFAAMGTMLDREFANVVRTLIGLTEQALPHLAQMALMIGRAIPAIVRMSVGFLQIANAIIRILGGISQLLGILGITPRMFGLMTAATLAFASAIALTRTAVIGLAASMVRRLGAAMIGYIARLAGARLATILTTVATWGLYRALVAVVGLITGGLAIIGLTAAVNQMGLGFQSTAGQIGSATDALREFDSVASGVGANTSTNPYGWSPGDGDDEGGSGGSSGGPTVINVESSGDADADNRNLERADWLDGRTTGP